MYIYFNKYQQNAKSHYIPGDFAPVALHGELPPVESVPQTEMSRYGNERKQYFTSDNLK
jgi:hypothetical protein